MNYFEHHIGDYDKNTSHLTACEDGIYCRLIRRYYDKEVPLTLDLKELQRLVRARTREEKNAVATILTEFFFKECDGYHHKTCDEVIAAFIAGKPDRELKQANENNRTKRHREERANLFKALTDAGLHAPWNIGIVELRELVGRIPVTNSATPETPPVTRPVTAPVTPVTATQSPYTNPQSPDTSIKPPAATHASAPPDGLFRMHRDWVPGEHFSDSLVFAGLKDYPFDDDLPEFVLYWAGKSESLSQGSWEHKFISSMKRNAARREQAGNEPTRIPRNWRPSAELVSALSGEGIPIDFLDAATTEFVAFWLEDGSAQRSWNAKFIQHVRTTFDRQPKLAHNAFDTLTDRSWADGILTLNALEQGDAQ